MRNGFNMNFMTTIEAAGAAEFEFRRMVDECIDGIPTLSTAMSYIISLIVFTSPWFAIMDLARVGWNTLIFFITLQRLSSFGSLTKWKGLKPGLLLKEGPGEETKSTLSIFWSSEMLTLSSWIKMEWLICRIWKGFVRNKKKFFEMK